MQTVYTEQLPWAVWADSQAAAPSEALLNASARLASWALADYTPNVGAPQTKFDAERKAAFVLAYERSGEMTAACAAIKISRVTAYAHLKSDPAFSEAIDEADGRLYETMMATVKKLAIDGVVKTTYDKDGNKVSVTRVYSERMLLAWLKRRRREDWGDKLAVDQTVNAKHTHQVLDPKKLPREARDRLREALEQIPESKPSLN